MFNQINDLIILICVHRRLEMYLLLEQYEFLAPTPLYMTKC